ncbi:MAG: N(4)-(beta-N-acetylglucosaminyl)-L-asparaginase [Planctomycetaceae bacterium]
MKKRGQFPVKAISSANGLKATKKAYQLMQKGTDTLEATVAGVTIVENDPNDTSVGYGGLPNENGIVELDAAVMHGPTHRAGAVAAIQHIKNPAQVAMKVMERSDHVLLVGEGALQFALAHGFQKENLLTERARKIWLYWKETNSRRDDWLPPDPDKIDPDVAKFFKLSAKKLTPEENSLQHTKKSTRPSKKRTAKTSAKFTRPTGTIHCAAINAKGEISCTTTTSGLAFKIPGRVGDSPIIGAGLYVDNEIGSCGSTGRGEANLQNLCSAMAVELMRNGASPKEAGMEILRRVASHTHEKRLLDEKGRPNFGLKFYLLNKKGEHAGVSMWGPAEFAITDKKGTRLEKCTSLYQKSKS